MKLLKPAWINHDDHPIFSIDIHPDGTRFATGGQGQDSAGRIVIWNMIPVVQFDNNNTTNTDNPKILCQLDHHNACVNCVRWSHSGKYLASGGDDKAIMIWKLISKNRPNSLLSGNGFGKPCYETWRPMSDLRNHKGDILHLAWSPEDKYLASASVDNTVIIWDAQQFPLVIQCLDGHTSLVKGVTWDPIGKYVAAQSDDKTLKIWRTSDWQLEHSVSDPFHDCGGTTHVLRLDWSPDGLYLVSAHAMNEGGPTAQIIERDEWKTDKDFVGHRKAVVCVRFNQNILQQEKSAARYCMVALGSRDKSISVWSTALKRPVVVVRDVFTNSVMDLSWSSCGQILMACSWDGTVAVAKFKRSEIGTCLTSDEKVSIHQRFYGDRITINSSDVVQNLEVFLARKKEEDERSILGMAQQNRKSPDRTIESEKSESQELIIRGPTDKQIETRTSDGKRRITPKFLLPTEGVDVQKDEENNSNHFGNMKDSDKKESIGLRETMISNISEVKIPVESRITKSADNSLTEQQVIQGARLKDKGHENNPSSKENVEEQPNPSESKVDSPIKDNPVESTAQIEPVCLSTENALPDKPVKQIDNLLETQNQDETSQKVEEASNDPSDIITTGMKRKRRLSEEMKPPAKLPKKGKLQAPTIQFSMSSTASTTTTTSTTTTAITEKIIVPDDRINKISPLPVQTISPSSIMNGHTPVKPKPSSSSRHRLSALKIEPNVVRRIQTKKEINYTLEVDNKSCAKGACVLSCHHDKSSLSGLEWNVCLMFAVCGLSGDSTRIVALCEDSTAHILDLKGRYSLPPLILHSFPSKLFHQGPYLLVVTVKATLHLWNIHTKKSIIKSESIAPLLDQFCSNDPSTRSVIDVAQISLTQQGSPVIMLTDGRKFHFNLDMQSWMQYTDPGMSINNLNIELKPWQQQYNKFSYSEMRNLRKSEPYIITQMKLKLATATELQLTDAVHTSIIALAKSLAVYGLKQELRQLLEDLLGPTHSSAKLSNWNPTVVGVEKRVILREILKILVLDLEWQDFFCEFNDMLASVDGSDTEHTTMPFKLT